MPRFDRGGRPARMPGVRTPQPAERLDPSLAIRPGTFDARAVLLLWCYRRAWFPLFWLGMIVALFAGVDPVEVQQETESLAIVGEWLRNLLSPLAGVILAFFVRFSAGWLALGFAYPLSRGFRLDDYRKRYRWSRRLRLWRDRLVLSRAYRSLRWSAIVRQAAADRLGRGGRRLMRCDSIVPWAVVVLIVAYVLVYLATSA